VTASYAGASAEVVEATVAQPIEARVVGVDNIALHEVHQRQRRSYTLTVTFAVGTDPDLNTVKVQNRVGLAEAQRPPRCAPRASASQEILGAAAGRCADIADGRYDQLFLSNYATINIIDSLKRIGGVGDVSLFSRPIQQ